MKTRIQTTDLQRTKARLLAAGLDPRNYVIGPTPAPWYDMNLDELIRRDRPADAPPVTGRSRPCGMPCNGGGGHRSWIG